jgi:hypothetical protein
MPKTAQPAATPTATRSSAKPAGLRPFGMNTPTVVAISQAAAPIGLIERRQGGQPARVRAASSGVDQVQLANEAYAHARPSHLRNM